jgi:peptidoglycan/LPS O-acetylase OafA/YrhL
MSTSSEAEAAVANAAVTEAAVTEAAVAKAAPHSPGLDGLRGIAIALVVLHNVNVIPHGGSSVGNLVSRVAGIGWVGVSLFFVLSGFLITRGLLATRGAHDYFKSFFGRRALRIFPLYYLTLSFFFVLVPGLAQHGLGDVPQSIVDDLPKQHWYWLYLTNWTQHAGLGGLALAHLWSLAVEEQFYLVWPFAMMALRTSRQVLALCTSVIVIAILSRVWMVSVGANPMQIYTFTICRMDALAMGAAAAALLLDDGPHRGRLTWHSRPGVWLGVSALALVVGRVIPDGYGMVHPAGQIFGYALFGIASTALLLATLGAEAAAKPSRWASAVRALSFPPLRSLGKYSYAIYVFHPPVHEWLGKPLLVRLGWAEHPSTLQGLGYIVGVSAFVYALAWLSYHAFEKHFLKLKRHFNARPATPHQSPTALA